MSDIESISSLFADLREAIKKASDGLYEAICKTCDMLCTNAAAITDTRNDIDRLEAEALAIQNAEAALEAVPFDVMLEKLEAFEDECRSITRRENAMFWDEDARLLGNRLAARQREIVRAMQDESARQAMKRRKMMHDDGHFPDSIRLAGKQA